MKASPAKVPSVTTLEIVQRSSRLTSGTRFNTKQASVPTATNTLKAGRM